MTNLFKKAESIKEYCTNIRHMIHQNPEVSFKEFETTELIKKELKDMDIDVLPLDIATGVVAEIKGTKKGPEAVTALRADIDALQMEDLSGKPYASKNPGVAHACGHDGHTAILLGAAKLLNEVKDQFSGVVKLVFQPAEEGLYGSRVIIDSGALKNPDADAIICLHGWPYFKVGEIGAWPGPYMASADKFLIKIIGQSGHGARPYKAVNPIMAAASAINAIPNIVSNEIVTAKQAVVTVCTIHAGMAFNVIPDSVEFGGTVRCLDPEVRDELEAKIRRVADGAAQMFGCRAEIDYQRGVPPLMNDPGLAEQVIKAGADALGNESIRELDGPVMGSEDFSYYIDAVGKGVFYRLGIGTGEDIEPIALHNSKFDFNDDAIPYGVATMVQLILNRHS